MKSFGVEKPKWQRIKFHVTKIFIQRKRPFNLTHASSTVEKDISTISKTVKRSYQTTSSMWTFLIKFLQDQMFQLLSKVI